MVATEAVSEQYDESDDLETKFFQLKGSAKKQTSNKEIHSIGDKTFEKLK
jgi:hypothetical protein